MLDYNLYFLPVIQKFCQKKKNSKIKYQFKEYIEAMQRLTIYPEQS